MATRPADIASMHDRALDNLVFIRSAMEGASAFTAVPGWGGMLMGVSALIAAVAAHARVADAHDWTVTWGIEAVVGAAIGTAAMLRKAHRLQTSVRARPARRFALSFTPPLLVGALLTLALHRGGVHGALPGVWLLSYGTAVVTGGAFSIRIVPVMGLCFLAVGTAALFTPPAWGDAWMALGFGGLHLAFGWVIGRRHGG